MNQNIKKSIFIIILFLLLICSVSMVNAVDISDNNLTADSNHNILEINYNSNDNSYIQVENDSIINNNSNNSLKEKEYNSINQDALKVYQNSEINNINDLINGNMHNNYEISEIHYQNKTFKVYQYHISNEADLKNVSRIVYNNNTPNGNILLLDFENKKTFKITSWSKNLFNSRWKYLIIKGNNATIELENSNHKTNYHFLHLDKGFSCLINNITIACFNVPVTNHGKINIENSVFRDNEGWIYTCPKLPSYTDFKEKYNGGVIRNYGTVNAINSNFTNNIGNKGGVIYNEKGSFSTFINCSMTENSQFNGSCNNIYCCDGAQSIIISNKTYTFNISSVADLKKAAEFIRNNAGVKKYDCINLNFVTDGKMESYDYTKSDFGKYKFLFDTTYVPILLINGNGLSINIKGINKNDEFHFLNVDAGSYVIIRNLTIEGFNTAIINHGSLNIDNCHFYNNSVDYNFYEDYGGAIRNYGRLYCDNSLFMGNYAKKGGAIYNDKGVLVLEKCVFSSNTAYKHGGAIYSDKGVLVLEKCVFSSNTAYKEGGAIYNDKGILVSKNCDFLSNTAYKEGGAIYSDKGVLLLENCHLWSNTAYKEGGAIYNDFSNCSFVNNRFFFNFAPIGKDIYNLKDLPQHFDIMRDKNILDLIYEVRKNSFSLEKYLFYVVGVLVNHKI